jgi:hypothetical protein
MDQPRTLATIRFQEPLRAPVVRPPPAPAAVQTERMRLAELRRAAKAAKQSRGMK